jgi:hypothetical protein
MVKVTALDRTFQRDMMHPICRLDPEFSKEIIYGKISGNNGPKDEQQPLTCAGRGSWRRE